MEDNIKSKNIKFNVSIHEDKLIYDYFNSHKENFSKTTKKLLIEYITNQKKNEENEPIMELLEYHTKLLEQIIENGITTVPNINQMEEHKNTKNEEEIKESNDNGFNMDFLDQLK